AIELRGRRRTVVEPDLLRADRRRADERRDVRRDAVRRERVEPFAERGPRNRKLDVALPPLQVGFDRIAQRTDGAFAEHRERDALADAALRAAVRPERRLRVVQHVDEPRRDREAGGVHLLASARAAERADRRNPIAGDRDVLDDPGTAGAVVHGPVMNDEIVGRRRRTRRRARRRQQRNEDGYFSHDMPSGPAPGESLFITCHDVRSTTAIALSPFTATNARAPLGSTSTPSGCLPSAIRRATFRAGASIT